MSSSSREAILAAARRTAQAHGYSGLNFRDLADEVGIKAASIYHHFPSKADLGAAVARRYWEDTAAHLESMLTETPDPVRCLQQYPDIFRKSLESDREKLRPLGARQIFANDFKQAFQRRIRNICARLELFQQHRRHQLLHFSIGVGDILKHLG